MAHKLICALVAMAAVGVAAASPAHADPYDFVLALDDQGVYYSSVSEVIDQGKMTCRILRNGAGVPAAINYLAGDYAPFEIGVILRSASMYMCPDVAPVLRDFFTNAQSAA